MAMENLHQIVTEYDYEKIIVDTPPSTHALDFFDAPERMVNAITNSMLKTLVKPSVWAGHKSGRLLSMFGSLTGTSFFQEMSDFLAATVSLLDGFKDRAESVMKLMTSDETELVLVATATPGSMHDAFDFIGSVLNRQLTFAGCIINRVSVRPAQNTKTVEEAGKWCKKQKDKELQKIGNEMLARGEMYKMEKKLIGGLAKKYSRIPIYKIPQKPDLIHSIKGLNDFYSEITKD
jgi:anion-transporting  ArsA/GET3 family ATPase